jgi:hypothetical protein
LSCLDCLCPTAPQNVTRPRRNNRIHARAFGGDLHVMSMQGHGTDVYVHINKMGDREVSVP